MRPDFFDRLEVELAGLARDGAHLDLSAGHSHRQHRALISRILAVVILAVVLAASLLSEFPATATATATGHAMIAQVSARRTT
ncbi:MAG: hypothetical protein ACYC0H_20620 [Solirubrobacteraceae bacterium]